MQAIKPYAQIYLDFDGKKLLEKIEQVARTCYKSENKIKDGSAEKMVAALVRSKHEAMLEHATVTVKFIVNRSISHEIVRHRIASFAQESQRYCNYSKDDFGNEITFIIPNYIDYNSKAWDIWKRSMLNAEKEYFELLNFGCTPEEARDVLPNATKTELVMTANLREWRHFFKLRAADATGKAHPQMKEVTIPLLEDFKRIIPVVFDDIQIKGE